MSMTDPRMKLLKFGADFCGPCKAMDRARTLEKFVQKHPNVAVTKYTIADKKGDVPANSSYDEHGRVAKLYEIVGLPTIIFETEQGATTLARAEGGMGLAELEKLYQKALKKAAFHGGKPAKELVTDADLDEDAEEEEGEEDEAGDDDDEDAED